mmetsp:Transcript_43635/g.103718  ORF Transcript_43635/g.103718 Transcript_43635/m.103718 type:complete len:304 (+) Transcript_43635:430-1341(+)
MTADVKMCALMLTLALTERPTTMSRKPVRKNENEYTSKSPQMCSRTGVRQQQQCRVTKIPLYSAGPSLSRHARVAENADPTKTRTVRASRNAGGLSAADQMWKRKTPTDADSRRRNTRNNWRFSAMTTACRWCSASSSGSFKVHHRGWMWLLTCFILDRLRTPASDCWCADPMRCAAQMNGSAGGIPPDRRISVTEGLETGFKSRPDRPERTVKSKPSRSTASVVLTGTRRPLLSWCTCRASPGFRRNLCITPFPLKATDGRGSRWMRCDAWCGIRSANSAEQFTSPTFAFVQNRDAVFRMSP